MFECDSTCTHSFVAGVGVLIAIEMRTYRWGMGLPDRRKIGTQTLVAKLARP